MTTDIGFVTDGAAARMADDKGTCVCSGSMTDVGGDCMPYSTLIPAIIGSLLGAAFLIVGAVRSHPIPCKPIHTLFLRKPPYGPAAVARQPSWTWSGPRFALQAVKEAAGECPSNRARIPMAEDCCGSAGTVRGGARLR